MTVMGEILTEGLSDAGSTPARSTHNYVNLFQNEPGHGKQVQVIPAGSTQKSLDFAKIETFLFHGNDVGIGIEF